MRITSTTRSSIRSAIITVLVPAVVLLATAKAAPAQNTRCDPNKVMTAEACAKCHINEVQTWKKTPHFQTFDQLGRRPEAQEICSKLGLRSAKRSDVCIDCHFTTRQINGRNKPISGISCESCHGASQDWLKVHNDYGGPTATRETESDAHVECPIRSKHRFWNAKYSQSLRNCQ